MAPLVTHLVIGERVFAQLQRLDPTDYGSFLLGCVLVDVHGFSDIDRHRTHFVGRLDEDGVGAFNTSCANFLSQLDGLLPRPWTELTGAEQAFVAGYLCHLAADEDWKQFGWNLMHALGIASLADLPVPGDVVMTVFDVLSSKMYLDFPAVVSALDDVEIPEVLMHVPHEAFQAMWDIVKEHVMTGDTPESYFEMLKRLGQTNAQLQGVICQHHVYWEDAVALVDDTGGVAPRIQAGVRRSLETIPRLWA
ncbi:MAG: zinc dependent phospholipase C family protein [Anaerolineae bacterium]